MPLCVGCLDGTLINIDSPSQHEEQFIDRHGNHSITAMVVCGPNYEFFYTSANWPGSVHDARVLRNSSLYRRMEGGWRPHPQGILLGDSAYPLKEWLITPKLNELDQLRVQRFNRAHRSTRRIIENAIGILKEKFPCLRHLRVNPRFAANVVKACVTLCNLSREHREEAELIEIQVVDELNNNDDDDNNNVVELAAAHRLEQLLNTFA